MSALKIKDDQGNWINLPGLKGEKGDKGDKGESGVYLGTTAPSDEDINVWINPNGEAHSEAVVVDPTLMMEGQAADAKVTGDRIGEPYETLEQIEYAIINGKKFNNRDVGNSMAFTDNTIYHYILLSVTAGDKYNVTTYFTSTNTYYIYMCDSNGLIVSRTKNASGLSGSQTFDIEIPVNVAFLYIQGYSSASLIASRMNVQKYIAKSLREIIDQTKASASVVESQVNKLVASNKANSYNPTKLTFQLGMMNIDGSVGTSTTFAYSRGIQLCEPTTINISNDDFSSFAINQYDSYNVSSARIVKNWKAYNKNEITVFGDSYPIYIRIGVAKGGDTITSDDLVALKNAFTFTCINKRPEFASIAMFSSFAVSGCSWDAGSAYDTSDGHVTHTGIGWAEILGRRNGCAVGNFAIGGSNLRSWFNDPTNRSGFRALLEADAYPLYILTEGNSNDANAFILNDADYSALEPSTTKYYIGTIDDISTRQDYHDYPCTFYGYYGRVIEMIQEHAPNTRIIISSPDTTIITTDIRKALRTACKNIANYYNLPYMDIETDPYYDTYVNALVGNHPTAPTYSGWAIAIERLFGNIVNENLAYFQLYSGLEITGVSVEWEPVSLS